MSNVINFPICRHGRDGRHWYGGRGYKTQKAAKDSMSDKDWRRIVQWESRHMDRILRDEKRNESVTQA
jgi:hypothetical protein